MNKGIDIRNRLLRLWLAMAAGLMFIFTACGATITVAAGHDGAVTVECNAKLGSAFMDVMRAMNESVGAVGGVGVASPLARNNGNAASPLLTAKDCAEIASNLERAGLAGAMISTPTADSIEVRGVVAADKNRNLLTATGCITVVSAGGKKVLSLVLNPETLCALYARLNEDIQAYLDLAMAGVFTGEAMTVKEWLLSLEIVYGKPFSEEAGIAQVTVNMSVTGDGGKEARRTFTVPLADIMTGQSVVGKVDG